jgi:hypothetical protein
VGPVWEYSDGDGTLPDSVGGKTWRWAGGESCLSEGEGHGEGDEKQSLLLHRRRQGESQGREREAGPAWRKGGSGGQKQTRKRLMTRTVWTVRGRRTTSRLADWTATSKGWLPAQPKQPVAASTYPSRRRTTRRDPPASSPAHRRVRYPGDSESRPPLSRLSLFPSLSTKHKQIDRPRMNWRAKTEQTCRARNASWCPP